MGSEPLRRSEEVHLEGPMQAIIAAVVCPQRGMEDAAFPERERGEMQKSSRHRHTGNTDEERADTRTHQGHGQNVHPAEESTARLEPI